MPGRGIQCRGSRRRPARPGDCHEQPDLLRVMIQQAALTFLSAPASTIPVLPAAPVRLVARDLNGDGNTDVVVSYQVGSTAAFAPDFVTVLLGDGFRSFGTPSNAAARPGQLDLDGGGPRRPQRRRSSGSRCDAVHDEPAGPAAGQWRGRVHAATALERAGGHRAGRQQRHQRRQPARSRLQHDARRGGSARRRAGELCRTGAFRGGGFGRGAPRRRQRRRPPRRRRRQ